MIKINLSPYRKEEKKKGVFSGLTGRLPKEVVIGVVGACAVVIVFISFVLGGVLFFRRSQYAKLAKRWEAEAPQRADVEKVVAEMTSLQKKLKDTDRVTKGGRVLWAPKLNAISDALPKRLWLSLLDFKNEKLTIKGTAASKRQDEVGSIGNLSSDLKKNNYLAEDFTQLDVVSIQRRKFHTLEVADFVITAELGKKE